MVGGTVLLAFWAQALGSDMLLTCAADSTARLHEHAFQKLCAAGWEAGCMTLCVKNPDVSVQSWSQEP